MTLIELTKEQEWNKRFLLLFFIYTTLSGAVRKWLLFGNSLNEVLLGIQIILPFAFLLAKTRPFQRNYLTAFIAFGLLLLVQAFNPLNLTLFHGIFGFFLHFGLYIPLIVYLNDRDAFPIEKLAFLFFLFAILESLLGTIQFNLPYDHILNRYVKEIDIATNSSFVRITGSFGYIGGFTAFLCFLGFCFWSIVLLEKKNTQSMIFLLIFVVITPMTGARQAGATIILFCLIGFYYLLGSKKQSFFIFFAIFLAPIAYYYVSQIDLVNQAYRVFTDRVKGNTDSGETLERIWDTIFLELLNFRGAYPIFGTGLGGTYQGAISLFGESSLLKDYGYYEDEPERIVLEGGFILFFARIFLWYWIIRRTIIPFIFKYATATLYFFYHMNVFNTVGVAYTVLGFMLIDKTYYIINRDSILKQI